VPLAENSNVVLVVGSFLAGPLLRWADESGGGFHFDGDSKIGKTLIGAIGQSTWGKPYRPGAGSGTFGFNWDTTANRLGERAVHRTDVGLYLDEIGIGDPNAIAKAVYKLAGGLDKGRYGQQEQDFNVLFVSTGELSLAEFLKNPKPGQLVRLVDIPAKVQLDSAFETIPAEEIAAAGRRYYPATNNLHGSIGYDWLCRLIALGPDEIKSRLNQHRNTWLALPQVLEIRDRTRPRVQSVVNRFALVAAALAMAINEKILPWSQLDTDTAIISCMQRWNQRGNTDAAAELLLEIERRRKAIAATINDRFIHLSIAGRRIVPATATDQHKMAAADRFDGFLKGGHILVKPEAWRRWWTGLDAEAVKKHLLEVIARFH
jgi:putative DNA primase/helicase